MDYALVSDFDLWRHCQNDDIRAYNELFRRYDPKLRWLAARYLKDFMQAEEAVMDMMYNIWIKRKQIGAIENVSNYMFRAMRNLLITRLRKKLPQLVDLEELNPQDYLERSADFHLREREAEQLYQEALDSLSPQRQKAFRLSREENLSYREIAIELGLSVNTVERHITSALKCLRNVLKEKVCTTIVVALLFSLL